jgi:hypothetical protein
MWNCTNFNTRYLRLKFTRPGILTFLFQLQIWKLYLFLRRVGSCLWDDGLSRFKGCRLANVLHVHFNFILRFRICLCRTRCNEYSWSCLNSYQETFVVLEYDPDMLGIQSLGMVYVCIWSLNGKLTQDWGWLSDRRLWVSGWMQSATWVTPLWTRQTDETGADSWLHRDVNWMLNTSSYTGICSVEDEWYEGRKKSKEKRNKWI